MCELAAASFEESLKSFSASRDRLRIRSLPHYALRTLLLLALALLGCSDGGPASQISDLERTPRENQEAEEIALLLSTELVAPQRLYEHVLDDLTRLRAEYEDVLPVDSIGFRPRCRPGSVEVEVNEETIEALRQSSSTGLDSLNAYYGISAVDTASIRYVPILVLNFNGRLHPKRLAEAYATSPSVRSAWPLFVLGDGSTVYPLQLPEGRGYLFRKAWGDCTAGCIYELYWYFKSTDDAIAFVGEWDPRRAPQPKWWPEASEAIAWHSQCGE
jgi:hypothetical protein